MPFSGLKITLVALAAWTIPSDDAIRSLLAERMAHNGVGVVVGVIEPAGQRVVAYGRSDAPNGRLDGDTVFQLGSLTKTFTTLLLADMVKSGEVGLEDPVASYLPRDVQMPERSRPITLLDLATHRSGLPSMPDNFAIRAKPNPIEAYTVGQLHTFLSSYEPKLQPGEKYVYSNLGVSLLGRLLATRAGTKYESVMKQRVLLPLGMRSTSITLSRDQARRLAPGHDRYLRAVDSWEMRTLQASGSLRSTANDMLLYLSAQLGYRDTPLNVSMVAQRTTRYPANGSQALGWGARKTENGEIFLHDGGKAGYRSAMVFDPEARTGIVILTNARTDDRPMNLALYLLNGTSLAPAPAAPERDIVKLPRKQLDRYAGRYQFAPDDTMDVIRRGNHLLVDIGNGGAEFYPFSETDFFLDTDNGDISFQLDAAGHVSGLWLYKSGKSSGKYQTATRIGDVP
jgi:serine-type D-Ala-D-Ala carboxypeptidase/endopeptidase